MAASPTPHRRRRNPPRTPGIKFIGVSFNSLVYNEVSEEIGRKAGKFKAIYFSYTRLSS
jgi:hypothetical protein